MQKFLNRRGSSASMVSLCCALLTSCSPGIDLDSELAAVEAQLESLPAIQPNMLCPTVGFGSGIFQDPEHTTWLDIMLSAPRELDTIVLIPALLRNKAGELETLGFPARFTIETWLEETPGTQHAHLRGGGWLYQPIGIYDPAVHPDELTYEFTLMQTIGGVGSAPVSVSLYYANDFEPADGRDVLDAPQVTQVDQVHTHPSWATWSTTTGKHTPNRLSAGFDLRSVPAGATLFLRIANETLYKEVPVDDIKLDPSFTLTNGDFETPSLNPAVSKPDIAGWYDDTRKETAIYRGANWAASGYQSGRVVVDYSEKDYPNPGVAPVVFTLPPDTLANKVRIRATRLQTQTTWRKLQMGNNFALNEVLLFDGMQNVALNSRAASADEENFPRMFAASYAVDGYSYFPPIDPKEVSAPDQETNANQMGGSRLMFDLGRICSLNEVRFYPVDRSPQLSHVYAMGVGFPHHITLRMSKQPDLNTAGTVLDITTAPQIGADPLLCRLNQVSGRYIWIEISEGQRDPGTGKEALGFSEIELLQNGTNLLAGVQAFTPSGKQSKLRHLTDGQTSSGIIMPQKEWLLALQRRAMLERKRDDLQIQQEGWLDKQRRLMQVLQATLLGVVLATLLIALLIRNRHRRNLRKLREKIGASLHDEVGANLSSIALSSEMLTHTDQLSSPQARQLNDDITRVAQETATEIRLLSRFLEKQGVESNLIGQFRRVERQMLPGMRTSADFGAPEQFNALTPTEKWELVLFLKEALHNIVKHAHATRVNIRTYAEAKQLHLEITDNGQGLTENSPPPVHLAKRAKNLLARLSFDAPKNGGTIIRLTIQKKRRHKK